MKALFNFLIMDDLVATNPVSRVKFLPEDNEQMRVLSFDGHHGYLAAASQPLRDIAVLMLETGMRPEEVYRIRKENVHLADRYMFNPYGKTKAAKRKVELTSEAKRALADRLKVATGPYLFSHQSDANLPIPKINNAHDRAVRLSRVCHFRLYDQRHTFATRAAMAGVDMVTLAATLGHSRIQMVLRYAHPTQEHRAKAMKRVEAYNQTQRVAEYERGSVAAVQ